MPQLNPNPWFLALFYSWVIMIMILQPKIKSHLTINQPMKKQWKTNSTKPWTWPWTKPSSTNSHPQKP